MNLQMNAFCTVTDCDSLTKPDNGRVDTLNGTTFGSTATYTCDTGYTLSGSQSRICGADGNWTSFNPLCEGKALIVCTFFSKVHHG